MLRQPVNAVDPAEQDTGSRSGKVTRRLGGPPARRAPRSAHLPMLPAPFIWTTPAPCQRAPSPAHANAPASLGMLDQVRAMLVQDQDPQVVANCLQVRVGPGMGGMDVLGAAAALL